MSGGACADRRPVDFGLQRRQLQAHTVSHDQRQVLDGAGDPVGVHRFTLGIELVVDKCLAFQPTHRRVQFRAQVILSIEEEAGEMRRTLDAFDGVALARPHAGCRENHDQHLRSVGSAIESGGETGVPSK